MTIRIGNVRHVTTEKRHIVGYGIHFGTYQPGLLIGYSLSKKNCSNLVLIVLDPF
jgi:hypothetical protein